MSSVEAHRFHDEEPCFPGCPAWDSKATTLAEWRESAIKFSDDYHAELNRRIETETRLAALQQVNEDRLMLVCDDCDEVFDSLATAVAHTSDKQFDDDDLPEGCVRDVRYTIQPESEAM